MIYPASVVLTINSALTSRTCRRACITAYDRMYSMKKSAAPQAPDV